MLRKPKLSPTDLRGYSRLFIAAVTGLADTVEALHTTILEMPGAFGRLAPSPVRQTTRLVYQGIGSVSWLVGLGIDSILSRLASEEEEDSRPPGHEAVRAALNGVMGDYLAATHNPLAISMQLYHAGQALEMDQPGLAAAIPQAGGKVLLLAHGLCMNHLQWQRQGHDHGRQLEEDMGYTPLYLHYNSGLHISANGKALAEILESLVNAWPVPITELAILGHSMGGLVAHSAYFYAARSGHTWPQYLRKLVFLGAPHHGAPLERGGQGLHLLLDFTPYTAPLARLGKIRSAGITDLRYGNRLDEDWTGRDRFRRPGDRRRRLSLPEGVDCYAIAGCRGKQPSQGLCNPLIGDGLVPVPSALGEHPNPDLQLAFPEAHRWVGFEMNHFDLLSSAGVYEKLRQWLAS